MSKPRFAAPLKPSAAPDQTPADTGKGSINLRIETHTRRLIDEAS